MVPSRAASTTHTPTTCLPSTGAAPQGRGNYSTSTSITIANGENSLGAIRDGAVAANPAATTIILRRACVVACWAGIARGYNSPSTGGSGRRAVRDSAQPTRRTASAGNVGRACIKARSAGTCGDGGTRRQDAAVGRALIVRGTAPTALGA